MNQKVTLKPDAGSEPHRDSKVKEVQKSALKIVTHHDFYGKILNKVHTLEKKEQQAKGEWSGCVEKGEETTKDAYFASSSLLGNIYLQQTTFYLSILLIKDWRKGMCQKEKVHSKS